MSTRSKNKSSSKKHHTSTKIDNGDKFYTFHPNQSTVPFSVSKTHAQKPAQAQQFVPSRLTGHIARDANAALSLSRKSRQITSENISELLLGSKKSAPGTGVGGKSRKSRKTRKSHK